MAWIYPNTTAAIDKIPHDTLSPNSSLEASSIRLDICNIEIEYQITCCENIDTKNNKIMVVSAKIAKIKLPIHKTPVKIINIPIKIIHWDFNAI